MGEWIPLLRKVMHSFPGTPLISLRTMVWEPGVMAADTKEVAKAARIREVIGFMLAWLGFKK
jgi:hypothetical protein